MTQTHWLDSLINNWPGILLAVAAGVIAQIALAFIMIVLGLRVTNWLSLVLVELIVILAGFIAALFAKELPLVSSLAVAIICAFVSLIASVWISPANATLSGIIVLFGSYCLMASLGGLAAVWIKGRRQRAREFEQW